MAVTKKEDQWCNTFPTILGNQSVCGRVKFPKYVCLVAQLGEQLLEKQTLKTIFDIV